MEYKGHYINEDPRLVCDESVTKELFKRTSTFEDFDRDDIQMMLDAIDECKAINPTIFISAEEAYEGDSGPWRDAYMSVEITGRRYETEQEVERRINLLKKHIDDEIEYASLKKAHEELETQQMVKKLQQLGYDVSKK